MQTFTVDFNHFDTDLFSRKSCGELQEEEKWLKKESGEKKDDGDVKDINYNSRDAIY